VESPETSKSQSESQAASQEAPDKAGIELAREIFHLLAHAITAMKLFPPYHATVTGFIDDLYAKLRTYFETRTELEVDVREHSFLVGGEVVHEEEHLAKSVPYLFHKDGMKKLMILREIDKTELRDFLEVIRKVALLPIDESDIVVALWEKDLPSIRIFAPDEYLLSKIDIFSRQPLEVFIDRRKLFGGQINLSPDDLKDIEDKTLSMGLMEQEEKKDFADMVTAIDDSDRDSIDSLLATFRKIPPEKEFHDMVFELVSLEDRVEKIVPILEFLERHHRELVREDKFTYAVQLLKQVRELEELFSISRPAKAAEIRKFLSAIPDGRTVELLQDAIRRRAFDSLSSFFDYLGLMGDRSIPLAAEFLAQVEDPEGRRKAVEYLEEAGRRNIDLLASQIQDSEPAVSKEIINLLGRNAGKRALSHLAALRTYSNKEIKLAALETLGSLADPLAQKILFEFLQDEDEETSAAASERLRWPGDEGILQKAIRLALTRQFHHRSTGVKVALMGFLARAGTPEAMTALRKVLGKVGFFNRAKREHTRLCAVEALARAGTPEARELLSWGLKSSSQTLSEACRRALEREPDKAPIV